MIMLIIKLCVSIVLLVFGIWQLMVMIPTPYVGTLAVTFVALWYAWWAWDTYQSDKRT